VELISQVFTFNAILEGRFPISINGDYSAIAK